MGREGTGQERHRYQAVIHAIDPIKDVDGFHRENVGGLVQGIEVLTPCTPSGCMRLLYETCGELACSSKVRWEVCSRVRSDGQKRSNVRASPLPH